MTNILFMILENCKSEFYYYPLRALAELYAAEVQERSHGKRLNSTNTLDYKLKKERMGRNKFLTDFKKRVG